MTKSLIFACGDGSCARSASCQSSMCQVFLSGDVSCMHSPGEERQLPDELGGPWTSARGAVAQARRYVGRVWVPFPPPPLERRVWYIHPVRISNCGQTVRVLPMGPCRGVHNAIFNSDSTYNMKCACLDRTTGIKSGVVFFLPPPFCWRGMPIQISAHSHLPLDLACFYQWFHIDLQYRTR